MNTPIKLSVSSILLVGILTGCSQQQIQLNDTDRRILNGVQSSIDQSKTVTAKIYNKQYKTKKIGKKAKKAKLQQNIGLPAAKSGQCYAKVKQPASYKTVTKRLLTQKAMAKRVFVRGAQYRWINKKVLARPASQTQRVIPAVYKTVTTRVMVKPSYLTWKKGKGQVTRIDNMTGEVLCRVKIPAAYKKVHRKVLVRAAKIIKTPRPAVYKTIKQKKLVSPAQYKTIKTPARFTTKQYRVKTASAKYIWSEVICKKKISKNYRVKPQKRKMYKAKKLPTQRISARYNPDNPAKKETKQPSYTKAVFLTKDNANTYKPSRMKEVYRQAQLAANIQPTRVQSTFVQPKLVQAKFVQPKAINKVKKANNTAKKTVKKAVNKTANKPTMRLTKQNAVLRIQKALSQRGFNPGGIDGKLGPATITALTAFQRKNGLAIGKLNRATLRALRLI